MSDLVERLRVGPPTFAGEEGAAEIERLRADAQKLQIMALGFAHAWCCTLLDKGQDPRNVEVPQLIADWDAALKGD